MAGENVLRIPRSDSPGDFVLVKVSSKSRSSELDLRFVATEGGNPYVGSVKASQTSKLRAKNYRGSDDEWAGILAYALGQKKSADVSDDWKSGLEVAAAVKSSEEDDDEEKEIVITLRKRIDTITQRLGAITLKQNDDEAIQLFEWTGIAVSHSQDLESEVSSLAAKYRSVEDTIAKLNSQLEDFIEAKNEHDKQLIAKFAQLLNEKKLKIRNQQRLLATAKMDPGKAAELEASLESQEPRRPESSRRSKRKANADTEAASNATESEDDFETMDVDKTPSNTKPGKPEQQKQEEEVEGEEAGDIPAESDRQSTPEPLEDETASEDEGAAAPPPPQRQRERESSSSSPPPVSQNTTTTRQRTTRASSKTPAAPNKTKSPPPRRELPFAKRRGNGNAKPSPAPVPEKTGGGEGSDTDDDEL